VYVSYVSEDLKRAPSKVDGLMPASLPILAPAGSAKLHVAMGSECKSISIVRIAVSACPSRSSAHTMPSLSHERVWARARKRRWYAVRSFVARWVERRYSAASNLGSMAPATDDATLS